MTAPTRPILSLCMSVLANQCDYAHARDGAGFSASDAGLGHRLAEKPEDRWTVAERRAAHRLALKYRRQLGEAGIDVDNLPDVPTEAPADALIARVPGPCAACGGTIAAGAPFIWGRERGSREHADATSCAARPSIIDESPIDASCRLCRARASVGELCADCALDLADLPSTRTAPSGRVRPSLRGRCVVCDGLAPPDDLACAVHAEDREALDQALARRLPRRRTPLTARHLLGNGGPIAQALPGYREREPQLQLAELVEAAIGAGEHATAEAGTGTGKSLGYLVPGLASGHRCIVSTADKALQSQLTDKDVPFLRDHLPFPFTAALLKGRGNYVCRQRVAEIDQQVRGGLGGEFGFRSLEAARAWPDLRAWVDQTETGDLETVPFRLPGDLAQDLVVSSEECTGRKCAFYGTCFAEGAKARAQTADLVIVNHALLLRDAEVRAQTGDLASLLPNATVLLLDEAHHLADVARDSFAAEVTAARWQRIARRIERMTTKHPAVVKGDDARKGAAENWALKLQTVGGLLGDALTAIQERLTSARATALRLGDERPVLGPLAGGLASLASELEDGAPAWLEDGAEQEGWRKMAKAAERLADDINLLAEPDGDRAWVRYAELDGVGERQRVTLIRKPIDVADLLRERLFERFDSVIACSATIATQERGRPSFDFWKREVGCDRARELVVGSPFDYGRQALLYLPPNGERFDPRAFRQAGTLDYYDRVADEVQRLILASRGRAFVLFTSYKMLAETHDRLAPRLRDFLVLRQGEGTRQALVRQFKADGSAVLFGTKSFWEGVDVAGEALSLVVIVGLPFAPPDDPLWAARCDAIERRGGTWFFELALPTAILALKQGFGRLIRSVDDRGVVALLDGRLTTARYGEQIIRSLPPATRTRSIEAVRAFFGA